MPFNLLNEGESLITLDFINKAGNYLEENPDNISKAISAIFPALIGGLHDKISTYNGASTLIHLLKNQNAAAINPTAILNSFGNDDPSIIRGMGILQNIFGDKVSRLTNIIAEFSGIKNSSTISLLSMNTLVVLGILGKHVADNNLNSTGLSSLLIHGLSHPTLGCCKNQFSLLGKARRPQQVWRPGSDGQYACSRRGKCAARQMSKSVQAVGLPTRQPISRDLQCRYEYHRHSRHSRRPDQQTDPLDFRRSHSGISRCWRNCSAQRHRSADC